MQLLQDTRVGLEVRSQRLAYQGELDGDFVADGELLVACHDTSRLLGEPDPALDLVSDLVFLTVEAGWAAAGRTSVSAVAGPSRFSPMM
ncbi:hypothetical protein G3I32_17535 [Streptomyces coelicoflavus]|uniref:Uncharacterized protein n=1 Tax=Streptomyces coelicoflavus TaxID=285562 RepID=A0A7K3PKZ0_9ACTN|nr:hypothetical protein [Streptomyces coelicoflavus]NEB10626.1 hypothetical protein [Streptomyces coelicoflavus]